MVRKLSPWGVLVLAAMALVSTPSTSQASFRMRIEEIGGSGQGAVITDFTNSGMITFSGAIGGFTVNTTIGSAQPPLTLNTAAYSLIDIFSLNVHGTGAGTLRIILERDGFTAGPIGPMGLIASVGGTNSSNNTTLFQGYANGANGIIGLGADQGVGAIGGNPTGGIPAPGSVAVFSGAGYLSPSNIGFGANGSANFNNSGTYSLAAILTLNFTGAGLTSGDYALYTTPEPATIVAALGSLPILGVWVRRRKSASATVAV